MKYTPMIRLTTLFLIAPSASAHPPFYQTNKKIFFLASHCTSALTFKMSIPIRVSHWFAISSIVVYFLAQFINQNSSHSQLVQISFTARLSDSSRLTTTLKNRNAPTNMCNPLERYLFHINVLVGFDRKCFIFKSRYSITKEMCLMVR